MPEIQDVSPTSSNSNLTSNADRVYSFTVSEWAHAGDCLLARWTGGVLRFLLQYLGVWRQRPDMGSSYVAATGIGPIWCAGRVGRLVRGGYRGLSNRPKAVLAITRNDRSGASSGGAGSSDSGIWRSTDGGSNWSLQHQFPKVSSGGMQVPPPAGQLVWAPGSDRLVYAAGGGVLSVARMAGSRFRISLLFGVALTTWRWRRCFPAYLCPWWFTPLVTA